MSLCELNTSEPVMGHGSAEFVEREFRRATECDQLLLLRGDLRGDGGNPRRNIERNGLDAVQVSVQQISRLDLQSANLDRLTHFNNMDIGVGDGDTTGKVVEAGAHPLPGCRAPSH